MDVNDIFKLPALPKSAVSGKRKAPPAGASAVVGESGPANKLQRTEENLESNGSRRAYVSDAEDEDGPAGDFAPNGDAGRS